MEINNITDNKEYLDSVFCHRKIPVGHGEYLTISGFTDLVDYVWSRLESCVNSDKDALKLNDAGMKRSIKKFLKGFR
jgi:hypothetical protein